MSKFNGASPAPENSGKGTKNPLEFRGNIKILLNRNIEEFSCDASRQPEMHANTKELIILNLVWKELLLDV